MNWEVHSGSEYADSDEDSAPNPTVVNSLYTSDSMLMMSPTVVTDAVAGGPNGYSLQLDPTQIRACLKRQVEYYFSRENLNHDTYLVSQMDADQFVDISIIANFNQVKKLTSDINLLVEVLKESVCVQVDETGRKVRPLHKRSMIILREIPEDTEKREIEEMLTHDECPPFISCEYATGNCWYIDFETEEQAQDAFRYLRETVRKFKGEDIKARIKAKPSTVVIPTSRPEQVRTELPLATTTDSVRAQPMPMTSPAQTIRYPVPLHHIPLQSPSYTTIPMPAHGHIQFMPYIMSPQVLPPWNNILTDPSYHYDMNAGYSYPPVPNQQRPSSQNSSQGGREWAGSNRGPSSNMSDRPNESAHNVASQNTSAAVSSKNTNGAQFYNSRTNSDNSNYHKHNGMSHRGHGYRDNHSSHDRNYSNLDNVPPRFKNSAQRERNHREKRVSSNANHYSQSHMSNSSRRSVNQQPQRVSSAETNNSVGQLPHSRATSGPSSSNHESRFDRGGKEYTNTRNANPLHNRNHGAHRNSKSPDKDTEPTQTHDIVKSQTFELDSSAFPALPGATTAISPTAANAISSDSMATSVASNTHTTIAVGALSQVPDAVNADSKGAPAAASDADTSVKTDSVSKLSDIVKNSIPELSKIADVAKSKPCTNTKDLSEKSSHSTVSKVQGGNKSQGASSYPKNRPTHLTNGVHSDKPVQGKGAGKVANPSPKSVDGESGKHSDKLAQLNKKESGEAVAADSNATTAQVLSTTSESSKISYAAIAATTTTAVTKAPIQDQSPVSPTSPSSGDNNNNADGKSMPSSKQDNLCYSTAAKNTSNNPTTAHTPRKSAHQHYRNGSHKPKNGDSRPTPNSPTNRSAPSSQTSSALVAR